MPLVDVVAGVLHVALLVEDDVAYHRVDRLAVLQRLGHLCGIFAVRALDALREGLDHRIGEQREAFRLESAGLDLLHRLLGLRLGLRVGREHEHRSLARRPGDLPEFRRGDRVGHDELEFEALLGGLTQDQAGLGVVAAEIDHVGLHFLQLGDKRRIVLFACIDAFVEDFLEAVLVHRLADGVGDALAVGALVIENDDVLAGIFLGDPRADEGALLIVARVKTHDRGPALGRGVVGHDGVGRGRAHHQRAALGIDGGGRNARTGTGVAVDEHDAVAEDAVGDRHGLLRIALIVLDVEFDLLAHDAALGVDGVRGSLRALLELVADGRELARHRPRDGERDVVGPSRLAPGHHAEKRGTRQVFRNFHEQASPMLAPPSAALFHPRGKIPSPCRIVLAHR